MLANILTEIMTRLDTVDDLLVVSDVRQVQKPSLPIAVVDLKSQRPENNNYKNSKSYKAILNIQIDLVHSTYNDLLQLIEDAEDALDISEKISGTIDLDYNGWNKEDSVLGSDVHGARLSLVVNYVRKTTTT